MTDDLHAPFLARIQAESDPRTAQAIYADWLEEQGDPRAELLRLAVEIRRHPAKFTFSCPDHGVAYSDAKDEVIRQFGQRPFHLWRFQARVPVLFYAMEPTAWWMEPLAPLIRIG